MLISQLSDKDTITLEIIRVDTTLILVSMYWDRQKPIEQEPTKVDNMIKHGIREGVIIAMASNALWTTWHDTTTNRGKQLDECIISKQLHIMKEQSLKKGTFEKRIGKSKIHLTLATSNVLRRITDWGISDEESNSEHRIISYSINTSNNHIKKHKHVGTEFLGELCKYRKVQNIKTQVIGEHNLGTEQRKQRGRPVQ